MLYVGNKMVKVNLGGQIYKLNDVINTWVALVKRGDKSITDVPEKIRTQVEFLINQN